MSATDLDLDDVATGDVGPGVLGPSGSTILVQTAAIFQQSSSSCLLLPLQASSAVSLVPLCLSGTSCFVSLLQARPEAEAPAEAEAEEALGRPTDIDQDVSRASES